MSKEQTITMHRMDGPVKHPNYKMRGIIENALKAAGALNTIEKKKYFIDFMVQTCATAWLSGLITTSKCELTVGDILRIAHTFNAPFEDHEITAAYEVATGDIMNEPAGTK